ncbi:hypothetical protein [Spirillospora sp. CA-294931]|uniref:hypothetical protein n=1 Tax=Spirillospora sp. CA-294931 TaxID=3240042 RepID=UPI003D8B1BA5
MAIEAALGSASARLAQAARIIEKYANAEPTGFVRWGMALYEVQAARDALHQAPSLSQMPVAPQPVAVSEEWSRETLHALAGKIEHELVQAAEQLAGADDKLACLNASLHAARLRNALG